MKREQASLAKTAVVPAAGMVWRSQDGGCRDPSPTTWASPAFCAGSDSDLDSR
jgi:hypothetical protein